MPIADILLQLFILRAGLAYVLFQCTKVILQPNRLARMQSQRQKKKNAQFKRKKHEAKERSEARSKRSESWSSEQRGNKEDESRLTLQPTIVEPPPELNATSSPASTERNRYRKRLVESNWAKYDPSSQGE